MLRDDRVRPEAAARRDDGGSFFPWWTRRGVSWAGPRAACATAGRCCCIRWCTCTCSIRAANFTFSGVRCGRTFSPDAGIRPSGAMWTGARRWRRPCAAKCARSWALRSSHRSASPSIRSVRTASGNWSMSTARCTTGRSSPATSWTAAVSGRPGRFALRSARVSSPPNFESEAALILG